MSASDVLDRIKDNDVKYVDLRFTDTKGKEQHVSVPAAVADDAKRITGKLLRIPRWPRTDRRGARSRACEACC